MQEGEIISFFNGLKKCYVWILKSNSIQVFRPQLFKMAMIYWCTYRGFVTLRAHFEGQKSDRSQKTGSRRWKIAAFHLNFTPLLVLKICQKAPGTNIGTYCGHTASLVGLDAFWQLLAVVRVLSVKFPYCALVHQALWWEDRVRSPASHGSGMWRTKNPRAFLKSSVYARRNEVLFRSLEVIPRELWRET